MLVSAVCAAAAQWLIVSVVSHKEGAAGLGQISLAQAYVTCLSYVAWLALRNHYIVEEGRYPFDDYLFLRVTFPAILFALLVLLAAIGGMAIWTTIAAFSCLKYAEGLSDLNSAVFQRYHKSHVISISASLRLLTTCSIFPIVYYATGSATPALISLALAWFVIYRLLDDRVRRRSSASGGGFYSVTRQALKRRWELFAFSLPLGVSSAVMILNTYIPRFGIDHLLGRAELGHFTAIQYFTNFGGMLIAVVCQAALPVLTRHVAERSSRHFFLLVGGLLALILAGGLLAIVLIEMIGRTVLVTIYGAGFDEVQPLFIEAVPWMCLVFVGSVWAAAATSLRLYRSILVAYIISVVLVADLTWLLLPRFGLLGSFVALGVASALLSAILVVQILVQWRRAGRSIPHG